MLQKIAQTIREHDNFLLACHTDPDGDALGSMVALYMAITAMGKTAKMACDTPVPANLKACLPHMEKVELQPEMTAPYVSIAVDCGDMGRVGKVGSLFDGGTVRMVIDHHGTNPGYGDICCVEPQTAATAVILWRLLGMLPTERTADMAKACYVGVSTDTGNFSFSNTNAEAFKAVGEMVELDIDLPGLAQHLFRDRSIERTRVTGICVNNLVMLCDGKVAVSGMTLADFAATGAVDSDTEGASGFLRDIDTVEAAAFVRETTPGKFKASVRSKTGLDVAAMCKKLGGGGHTRAAGCFLYGTYDEVIAQISEALIGAMNEVSQWTEF